MRAPLLLLGIIALHGVPVSAQSDSAAPPLDPRSGSYHRSHRGAGCDLLVEVLSPQAVRVGLYCLRESPTVVLGVAAGTARLEGDIATYTATSDSGTCTLRFAFKGKQVVVSHSGPLAPCRLAPAIDPSGRYGHFIHEKPPWDVHPGTE